MVGPDLFHKVGNEAFAERKGLRVSLRNGEVRTRRAVLWGLQATDH